MDLITRLFSDAAGQRHHIDHGFWTRELKYPWFLYRTHNRYTLSVLGDQHADLR
jgi:hypothetical protein